MKYKFLVNNENMGKLTQRPARAETSLRSKVTEMNLYTFIMNFLEGTYIHQVSANNEHDAMHLWLKSLNIREIRGFSEIQRKKLIEENFEDEVPILISGYKNVWCFGLRVSPKKHLALINFVFTKD